MDKGQRYNNCPVTALTIQPRLAVHELLNIIASHVALKDDDKQYFGLAYIDHLEQYHWLPSDRRVLECDIPRKSHQLHADLELHHSIKFFVDSVLSFCHPSAVELYFWRQRNDWLNDEKARYALAELIPIPNGVLHTYDVSLEDIERNVIELYKDLSGVPKGVAVLSFYKPQKGLQLMDAIFIKCATKLANHGLLALATKEYFSMIHLISPSRRRVVQSSGNANSILDSTGCLDSDDELAKAVKDPTTQMSVSRRSVASSAVQVHAFYCDSNFLCKTIWSTAVSLHQFYLDQRTCASAKRIVSNDPGVELKQLGEKLCHLMSHSSVASSLPSLNSLSSSGVPSAKVSDGSLISLSSLNNVQNREKTQEEKQKEVELYRELKRRKNELEEKLLAKLDELREVCIKEAEPKVKRRVGTAFSLSEEVFKRPVDSNDRISMLEADVELHRKIVAAAERLAKDKTTNKSLRLSASKPDVSTSVRNASGNKGSWRNCSDYQIESTSLDTRNDSNSLITKSCPATPRGSFPDLLTPRMVIEIKQMMIMMMMMMMLMMMMTMMSMIMTMMKMAKESVHVKSLTYHSIFAVRLDFIIALIELETSKCAAPSLLPHNSYVLPERGISWEKLKNHSAENHHIPVYENVGYKSCVSYKSSYREMNFPTLNDHTNCKDRVQRAFSDHDLPEQESVTTKSNDKHESRINYAAIGSSGSSRNIADYGTALRQSSWKYRFAQENSEGLCIIGARTGSNDTGRQLMIHQQQQNDDFPFSSCLGPKLVNSSLEAYQQTTSSCCNSPPIAGLLPTDGRTQLRYAVLPTSRSYNDGFKTASLDRRAMKERQSSCNSIGYHQLRSAQLAINDMVRETCIGHPVTRPSPLSTSRFTTFPVSGHVNVEKSKPLLSADIRRYQQRSPLQQCNSPEHNVTSPRVVQITGSPSNLRPHHLLIQLPYEMGYLAPQTKPTPEVAIFCDICPGCLRVLTLAIRLLTADDFLFVLGLFSGAGGVVESISIDIREFARSLIKSSYRENETEDSAHMAAASTTTVTSKILCRYFANNICREGSSCPFSHDRNSKPDRTCRYYLIGKCAFGTSCRYDHKRPPLDGIKTVKSFSRAAENSSSAKVVENGCSSDSIATTAAVNQSNHVFLSLVSLPLCPYFETGNCDKGDKCQFVHGDMCDLCNVPCLHPTDMEQRAQHRRECMDAHEAAMEEAFAEARSADKVCDCIRQWRGNQNDHFGKKTVRSCPECRTHSNFVIPATYWIEDQADKDDLIARFRENAKQKQCKYVKEGYIDDCPFGNKCFYKHELPDGTIVEGDSPRTLQRRRLSLLTGVWSFSDSDSEDDFSRIAQGIISRAFSLEYQLSMDDKLGDGENQLSVLEVLCVIEEKARELIDIIREQTDAPIEICINTVSIILSSLLRDLPDIYSLHVIKNALEKDDIIDLDNCYDARVLGRLIANITSHIEDKGQLDWSIRNDEDMMVKSLQHFSGFLKKADVRIPIKHFRQDDYAFIEQLKLRKDSLRSFAFAEVQFLGTEESIHIELLSTFRSLCLLDRSIITMLLGGQLPPEKEEICNLFNSSLNVVIQELCIKIPTYLWSITHDTIEPM
ncbi:hypothetical protein DINM_020602 [Dirofilaria immitis]|nr:hypothetical protein [Dirofilaria immitis]